MRTITQRIARVVTPLVAPTCIVLGAAVTFWATPAQAQAWLADRRYAEGAGAKVGEFELHPGIAAEGGYDSNWFLRSSAAGVSNGNVVGAGVLRITPSISIATLGERRRETSDGKPAEPPAIAFRGTASATYREFLGVAEVQAQRSLSANVDLRLDINPQRPWTLSLNGGYIRTIRPNTLSDPNFSFNTSNPYAGADLTWTPNNGTFDASLGYGFSALLFETSAGAPFTNLRHNFAFRNRWRFRPRTALFQETTLGIINYTDSSRSMTVLTNSMPLRSRVGINGLFGPRIGATAAIGYGGGFYSSGPATNQYDSLIAQVEGRFYLTDNPAAPDPGKVAIQQSVLSVGYTRDFENSYVGDVVGLNRGYAQLSYFIGGRAIISLAGGVTAAAYPKIALTGGGLANPGVTLIRPDAQVFGEYRFTDAFGVNLTLTYTGQMGSDTAVLKYADGTSYDMRFSRFQAFAGVRLFL